MGDLFDSSLDLEERQIAEGRRQGVSEGRAAGLDEGSTMGFTRGYQMGYEIGLYQGCVEVWRRRVPEQPGPLSPRAEAAVAALEQALAHEVEDPQDEAVPEVVEAARGKFIKAVALLGGAERLGLPQDAAAAAAAAAASSSAAAPGARLEVEDAALLF